jgi:hypothetical protein
MTAPTLNKQALSALIERALQDFHNKCLDRLKSLTVEEVLKRKNPYLFRAKGIQSAADMARAILDAFLASSEEELFGEVLERIAAFIVEQLYNGRRSAYEGIDLEFEREGVLYLVQVKSGVHWGNSAQRKRLKQDFEAARSKCLSQRPELRVVCVEGICYGRRAARSDAPYLVRAGQAFWEFLSGDPNLYLDLIEPLGKTAQAHSANFERRRAQVIMQFEKDIAENFCDACGNLDWHALLKFSRAER